MDEARIKVGNPDHRDGRTVCQVDDGIATFVGLRRDDATCTAGKRRRRQA